VVKLHPAQGSFEGEKCFDRRDITLKYHLLKGAESVRKVTVNGAEFGFMKTKKNGISFPLNADADAPDGDVICISIETDVNKEYEIKFYL